MFEIRRYTAEDKTLWDRYVSTARNATFLFYRDYMDYHADRFHDFSLLFYKGQRLYAILPAHREATALCSHFGLTYGGLLMNNHVTAADTCTLFDELNEWLWAQGFQKVVYRPVPWIYHVYPSEEDLYAIYWKCGARLQSRNIGTAISMRQNLRWRKDHLQRLRKAEASGLIVRSDAPLAEFWEILKANLMNRFQAKPVHTLEEIVLLKTRFPNNIVQYSVYKDEHIIGGILFYITPQVIHSQYSATNVAGKEFGAMEAIYNQVMYHDYPQYPYLDFGTSTEQNGAFLNEGLISHKEGYGGRSVVYDTYEWSL